MFRVLKIELLTTDVIIQTKGVFPYYRCPFKSIVTGEQ